VRGGDTSLEATSVKTGPPSPDLITAWATIARYTEPFASLVAELAYGGNGGPELAYRFERFGK
jgi:hypothetical protein